MTALDDRSRLEVPCLQTVMSKAWRLPNTELRVLERSSSDGVQCVRYRLGVDLREWRGLIPSYLA